MENYLKALENSALENIKDDVEENIEEDVEELSEIKLGKVVNCNTLNVRKEPSITSKIICVINKDTEVMIEEKESTYDFYKVYIGSGVDGFCMKKFITLNS